MISFSADKGNKKIVLSIIGKGFFVRSHIYIYMYLFIYFCVLPPTASTNYKYHCLSTGRHVLMSNKNRFLFVHQEDMSPKSCQLYTHSRSFVPQCRTNVTPKVSSHIRFVLPTLYQFRTNFTPRAPTSYQLLTKFCNYVPTSYQLRTNTRRLNDTKGFHEQSSDIGCLNAR